MSPDEQNTNTHFNNTPDLRCDRSYGSATRLELLGVLLKSLLSKRDVSLKLQNNAHDK